MSLIAGIKPSWVVVGTIALLLGIGACAWLGTRGDRDPVSSPGRFPGTAAAVYDGSVRTSRYLPLADGTRLAYDLILPAKGGRPAEEPLPALFKYTPYLRTLTVFDEKGRNLIAELIGLGWRERALLRVRAWLSDRGRYMDPLFRTPWLGELVHHGYAVIVVERPGTGASFGTFDPSHAPAGREAGEIIDWIAAQPWCDGRVGMFGDSFQAMIQMAAAATGNPHLKAIFPVSTPVETYDAVNYPGGVFNKAFADFFKWSTAFLESDTVTPVDGEDGPKLLAAARAERTRSLSQTADFAKALPFRDSRAANGSRVYLENAALYPLIDGINRAGVPICLVSGWYDLFSADAFFWYRNLTVPRRLIVRPHDHSGVEKPGRDLDIGAEARRWFDAWLKGIDNGIMREPPLRYYVMSAPAKEAWRTAVSWPLPEAAPAPWYFTAGRTGSCGSVNDGGLVPHAPAEGFDAATVDYTTTTGAGSRWTAVNRPRSAPDMRANDEKALTYTSAPLAEAAEIIGHPVVHLTLESAAADLDVFVTLEAVAPDGRCATLTEGNLRASHRRLGQPPFDNLGLPFHSHFESDQSPIPPGVPIDLSFALLPTAYRFPKGGRVRVAVFFADADNFETPVLDPAPSLRLLRGGARPSRIELPIARRPAGGLGR
jgi:hypothetical protein